MCTIRIGWERTLTAAHDVMTVNVKGTDCPQREEGDQLTGTTVGADAFAIRVLG